jgi:benzoyl-CoA reductase/2-hydroxyglutaryl-CoA dehydratase subunit BcrC/BadD/HgdB
VTRLSIALFALSGESAAQDRVDALIERLEQQDREIAALREEVQELRLIVPPPPLTPSIAGRTARTSSAST